MNICIHPRQRSVLDARPYRLRNVTLVSRRFNEACQDPALWPELRIQCADFQTEVRWKSFLRWLDRRASGLQILVFNDAEVDYCHHIPHPTPPADNTSFPLQNRPGRDRRYNFISTAFTTLRKGLARPLNVLGSRFPVEVRMTSDA